MINCLIANVKFSFSCVSNLMKKQLEKYKVDEKGEIIISTEIVDTIEIPNLDIIYHSKYYDVYKNNNEIIQIQKSEETQQIIGMVVYRENSATILLENNNINRKEYILTEYACFYYILKKQNAILIHSSSIEYNNNGVLFIASSGVGKSTQAHLWKEYMNINQINDDKNIIIEENNELYIYGNPWSGKSLIDTNKKIKLTNLVFIKRSETNFVKSISKKEEFLLLMPHITNPSFMYNREKWNQLTNKLMEIDGSILNCNISQEAVIKLKEYLEEQNNETK